MIISRPTSVYGSIPPPFPQSTEYRRRQYRCNHLESCAVLGSRLMEIIDKADPLLADDDTKTSDPTEAPNVNNT